MHIAVPEELRGTSVTLRRYRIRDIPDVRASIAASFSELSPWMPWAQSPPTGESVQAFVEPSAEHFGGDKDANYAITFTAAGGRFVGSCGLMHTDTVDALEIGYWVDSRYTGRGVATAAAELLTAAALAIDDVHRVVIRCDAANVASARVPEKLGYLLEGVEDKFDRDSAETVRAMTWIMHREDWSGRRT